MTCTYGNMTCTYGTIQQTEFLAQYQMLVIKDHRSELARDCNQNSAGKYFDYAATDRQTQRHTGQAERIGKKLSL